MTDPLTHDLASESGISEPWLGELVRGMQAIANAPIRSDASQLVVRAAAEAQHRSAHTMRPARRRTRRGFVPVLRRGLVFNLAIGAVLLIGTAALAVGSVEAGVAPDFVEDIVMDLTERVGITVTPPTTDGAGAREPTPTTDGIEHPLDPVEAPGTGTPIPPGLHKDSAEPEGLPGNSEIAPGHADKPGNSDRVLDPPGLPESGPGNSDRELDPPGPPAELPPDQGEQEVTDPTVVSPGNSGTAPGQTGELPPGYQEAEPPGGAPAPGAPEAGTSGGPGANEDAGSTGANTANSNAGENPANNNAGGKRSAKQP